MSENKALAPMETFIERVKGKLRDDIGSLLPDEAVSEMVQKVINDEFFAAKRVRTGGTDYHPQYGEKPTAFQEAVLEACKPIIERHVGRVLVERSDQIEEQIQAIIGDGITKFFLAQLDALFKQALEAHSWSIQSAIEQNLRNRGISL